MKHFIILLLLLPLCSSAQNANTKKVISPIADTSANELGVNILPDKETAIAVAEPILFKIFGKKAIMDERPYKVDLVDGYWKLSGIMPESKPPKKQADGYILIDDAGGGTFFIVLSKKDGRVVKVNHSQ